MIFVMGAGVFGGCCTWKDALDLDEGRGDFAVAFLRATDRTTKVLVCMERKVTWYSTVRYRTGTVLGDEKWRVGDTRTSIPPSASFSHVNVNRKQTSKQTNEKTIRYQIIFLGAAYLVHFFLLK